MFRLGEIVSLVGLPERHYVVNEVNGASVKVAYMHNGQPRKDYWNDRWYEAGLFIEPPRDPLVDELVNDYRHT